MSHDLLRFALRVWFTKAVAIELSVQTGVGGCGWFKAANMCLIGIAA